MMDEEGFTRCVKKVRSCGDETVECEYHAPICGNSVEDTLLELDLTKLAYDLRDDPELREDPTMSTHKNIINKIDEEVGWVLGTERYIGTYDQSDEVYKDEFGYAFTFTT
eukprot:UN05149